MSMGLFVNSTHIIVHRLCVLFNVILASGDFPDLWTKAIISQLHKTGSVNEVGNYRGISLLCTLGKIFTKILNYILVSWANMYDKIDERQCAYRKYRGTIDNMFSLYGLAEKYLSKKRWTLIFNKFETFINEKCFNLLMFYLVSLIANHNNNNTISLGNDGRTVNGS